MDALILCFLFHVFLNRRYYVSMLRALLHGKADGRSSTTTPVGMGCENLRSAIKKDVPGQQEHPFRIIYGSCPLNHLILPALKKDCQNLMLYTVLRTVLRKRIGRDR